MRHVATRTAARKAKRSAMSLVEVLISLAISASLLTATAFAVDAAFQAYRANLEQATLLQNARVTLNRMTTSIRTSHEHSPITAAQVSGFTTGATVTDSGVAMFVGQSGQELVFRHDPDTQQVLAVANGVPYVLLSGVQQFQVTLEPMRSAASIRTGGPWDLLRRCSIQITLGSAGSLAGESGAGHTLTVSASVMPRANSW